MTIYLQCKFGQQLIQKSNRLAENAFHSNWIEQSQQYRQHLLIFMQGAQSPIATFAGGLFRVDLSTCLTVNMNNNNCQRKIFDFFNPFFLSICAITSITSDCARSLFAVCSSSKCSPLLIPNLCKIVDKFDS